MTNAATTLTVYPAAQGGKAMAEAQPNLHRRRLGAALKGIRMDADLSLTAAAVQLDISKSALSKIENGKQRVPPTWMPKFFAVYGCAGSADAALISHMATMASSGKRSNLLNQFGSVVHGAFAQYLDMEQFASKIDIFSLFVPGLLQTEGYARALMTRSHKWSTKKEIESFVELRMARQATLLQDSRFQLWCVLDELALRRQVGDRQVMREQLQKLTELSEDFPNVAIQVLPFTSGSTTGADGAFLTLGFPAGPPVVVVEPLTTSLYLEEESDIELYEKAFNHLRADSLDVDKSHRFISEAIKEYS